RAYFASGFAQYVLPVTVGADALRAAAVGRGQQAVAEVGASIVAERLLGLVASGVMSCVALAVAISQSVSLEFLLPWALLSIGAGAAAMVLPLSPTVGRLVQRWQARLPGHPMLDFLRRLASAFTAYRRRAGLLALVALLSVLEQWFPVALMWTAGRALGVPLSLAMVVTTVPLTLFVGRLPISLGGLGVGEGAIVFLLGLFAIPANDALAVSVLCRGVDLLVTAVPGVFLWRDLVRPLRATAVSREVVKG
ncbi:MAG TPA: lysylphosphatidylglycerol synthase transmembrane domain-containing protein, partial [Gemmatimonadales bacterium]|nr:lysylphosphatidylglycerol synthase transmembrane domain-containing protein [Gemmatimonadales bacterium]